MAATSKNYLFAANFSNLFLCFILHTKNVMFSIFIIYSLAYGKVSDWI